MNLQKRMLRHRKIVESGCWEWTGARHKDGYGLVFAANNGWARSALAHRLSYIAFVGPIPEGLYICHKCNNPICINPDHLYAGTQLDNMRDRTISGRAAPKHGELNGRSILTADTIPAIRNRLNAGESCKSIASDYGVSHYTIFDIKRGKNWQSVKLAA